MDRDPLNFHHLWQTSSRKNNTGGLIKRSVGLEFNTHKYCHIIVVFLHLLEESLSKGSHIDGWVIPINRWAISVVNLHVE